MLKHWRWSRKLRPNWEITKIGIARITYSNNNYYITLPIEVKYTSRDPRHTTRMDCGTILMDMYNLGKGRDKEPYRLRSTTELVSFDIPKMDAINKCYSFSGVEEGMPLLGEHTLCKIIAIGRATIHGISKPITLQSKKIKVAVLKNLEEI